MARAQVNPAWQRSGMGKGLIERLTAGRVLDGPLKQRIKPSEACWSIGTTDADLGSITKGRAAAAAAAAGASSSVPLCGRVELSELTCSEDGE